MDDAHFPLKGSVARDTKEALNILVVAPLPFYSNGVRTFHFGVSVFYAELLPGLARLGHTVRVIAEAPPAQDGQQRTGLSWDVSSLAVEWFAFEYHRGSGLASSFFPESEKAKLRQVFTRMVKAEKPDVVLLGRETLALPVVELCREYGLPSLLVVHGSPTANLLKDTYPETVKQKLLECFAQIDCLVTVALHLEKITRSLGISQVCTIPNMADPARFRPEPKDQLLLEALHISPHQTVVGHISNLRPVKRPLDLAVSAEIVLRSNLAVVYLIVGNGPCREEMEELGRSKGIAGSFRYVGEIEHQQVPRYLNLSDIVVLPSEREGFPLVYREAQACSRVLLVSDIPAAREAVVDGETGLLFRLGDIDDLAAKTLALTQDPALRQRIGEKARAVAAAQTPERWVQAYAEVLQRTVAGRTGSP